MDDNFRIRRHPVLHEKDGREISFFFEGREIRGKEGEPVTSALFAAGIRVFGKHPADGSPQGLFCANGQCSQCLVIADGVPVKGCMTPVAEGMDVRPALGYPGLPADDAPQKVSSAARERECDALVIGGGPSGVTAALELAAHGFEVVLADDKHELGGKLVLQTHSFFGSVEDCWAGTRGIDIAGILARKLEAEPKVEVWLNSNVAACFSDMKFGVLKPDGWVLVKPRGVIVAAGAREKSLAFPGWDLPGVYGAGAFQTLVNRDRVRCAKRVFILGGGNVGLIAAYHALQAGIRVVGLVEALPEVGGYKVHKDKIARLGVPVWTSHTVVRVEGQGRVEKVVIAQVDGAFKPVPGTERAFEADTLLVAVGLTPVDELLNDARSFGFAVRAAGDAQEIAEASAAMFSGRIEGRKLVRDLGGSAEIPPEWEAKLEALKSKPGPLREVCAPASDSLVYPVLRCTQEIPCDPCVLACPKGSIEMEGGITGVPRWTGLCTGCGKCVSVCPGLAITLVDERKGKKGEKAWVTVPFEMPAEIAPAGSDVEAVDAAGRPIGAARVVKIKDHESQDRRLLVTLEVDWRLRREVAGFRVQGSEAPCEATPDAAGSDPIVCKCERVRRSEILREIREGVRDMNQMKSRLRCAMGACGGKTCRPLIKGLFRQEGLKPEEVTDSSPRPFVTEIPMGVFAGLPAGKPDKGVKGGGR